MNPGATHAAYEIRGPAEAALPLVLDSPHSGNRYPDDFGACVGLAELRAGEDMFVDELWNGAAALGAPLIAATFPRIYIDPNRHAGDMDLDLIEGEWPWEYAPSGKAKVGKALIWRTLEDGRPIYAGRLAPETVRARIERYHAPYQAAVKHMLDSTHARFGTFTHINCHSMRSVAGKMSSDGAGSVRGDIVLGDRDGTTCAPELTALVRETLFAMGYDVRVNDPYKGVELVRAFSNPAAGRHSLQIEINKRLYMDETSLEKTAGFGPLQANLTRLLDALVAYAKASRPKDSHG